MTDVAPGQALYTGRRLYSRLKPDMDGVIPSNGTTWLLWYFEPPWHKK